MTAVQQQFYWGALVGIALVLLLIVLAPTERMK